MTAIMRANRKVDTSPELRIRSALHRRGLRFRKHLRIDVGAVRVTPDVVFPGKGLAVFVDGCFWHGCPEHGTRPTTNREYWSAKLTRNRVRDARVDDALISAGWQVLRLWEHVQVEDAVKTVTSALRSRTEIGASRG
ncbi:MAG TPA: very short patch repair endonuclease [Acidimicrobiales bacterium]|nr:very short patch repair endonuclease [Acidimicrobiales bacterium]